MKYAGYELTDIQTQYVEKILKSSSHVGKSVVRIQNTILISMVSVLIWTLIFDGPPMLGNLILFYYGFVYSIGIFAIWWLFRLVTSSRFQGHIVDKTLFNYSNYYNLGNRNFYNFKIAMGLIAMAVLAASGWWTIAAAVGIYEISAIAWRAKLIAMIRWRLDEIQSHFYTPPRLFAL